MSFDKGCTVWLPCEVKPGPFSDERLVKVQSPDGNIIAFVNVRFLKNPIESGPTEVRAKVVDITDDSFSARLPGHSVTSNRFTGERNRVAQLNAV